jgi:mono/diheme cytochrome c family protein
VNLRLVRKLAMTTLVGLIFMGGRTAFAQDIFAGHYKQQTGQEIYRSICQGCHMPDAKGAVGAGSYPALANDKRLQAAVYPVTVLLYGQRAMPPFADSLSDAQIANVINYVRTHFGNHYKDEVTPAAVQAVRSQKETGQLRFGRPSSSHADRATQGSFAPLWRAARSDLLAAASW